MALATGTRLGRYEIVGLLGAGGMGEVYRARDPGLGRTVALKVLPASVAADQERLRRFEQEARAAGALNHPNVLAVHDVGSHEGTPYVVSELLEGETLRDRLRRGVPGPRKASELAMQAAQGLAAAHEKGIVHRDLKPENLFLTRDGRLKILDFGLAKLREDSRNVGSEDETATRTRPGVVLGTSAYLSPEQARGLPVDPRCDIFTLGVVLYEMLAGRRPFAGGTTAELMAAILREDPPALGSVDERIPRGLARIVQRCLEKDPNERFQHARDLAFALEVVGGDGAQAPQPSTPASGWRNAGWAAAGLVIGALVGALGPWSRVPSPTPRPIARLSLSLTPAEQVGGVSRSEAAYAGFGRPSRAAVLVSPDGRFVVFNGATGATWRLYLRRMDEKQASPIPGTEGALNPFLSPDGRWLAFWVATGTGPSEREKGELRKVGLSGGIPVTLCETADLYGASWGPDDTIVFANRTGGLQRVSSTGGRPETLTRPHASEYSHRLPQVLPGAHAVLFTVRPGAVGWRHAHPAVHVLATGERRDLNVAGADARYVPSGHLLFVREGTLFGVPFDLARLRTRGSPVPLLENVMQAVNATNTYLETGAAQFSVSESGVLVFLEGGVYPDLGRSLAWVDREGRVDPLSIPAKSYWSPRLSPDGRRAAVRTTKRGELQIEILDIARGSLTPLTHGGTELFPVWAPDGERLAYVSMRAGSSELLWTPADGSGPPERLATSESLLIPCSWSPDGRELLLVEERQRDADTDVLALQFDGTTREPRRLPHSLFAESHPALSPDGRWLAYVSSESGEQEVYLRPYPGPGARTRVSIQGGNSPTWAASGRELFFQAPSERPDVSRMMAVAVTTSPSLAVGRPGRLFEGRFGKASPCGDYAVTRDGRRFLMVQTLDGPSRPATRIEVVLNWVEELKRRVPTD
jgi:serine/threonine protein kinase/Tol biopolymer transport system component